MSEKKSDRRNTRETSAGEDAGTSAPKPAEGQTGGARPPPAAADTALPPEAADPTAVAPVAGEPEPEATIWHGENNALRDMMAENFIEYASYVLKDRAIPDIDDGMKPVQRRILHTLFEIDDGRFHKVANVIGQTMRFHPHGDASIGDALVVLANKEYFIDRQGNFGNIYTGDQASAARYIECRLSNLAREVLFNPEITEFIDSYDGRNKEPVSLPAKVPALLMMGSDGIGVGMSTHILPHNFGELLKAQIAILRNEPFTCYPDFLTGGIMDVKEYEDGAGRIRVRAKIDIVNDKTLVIRDIPPQTTTESLMASIEDAARRGKIKISSINDYTAEAPEIEISLPRGVYAEDTVKRLYGYTDCEVSIVSNLLVIQENRPVIKTVSEVLHHNTNKLLRDLQRELEIAYGKLEDRFHEKTLAQIFIENRIYKRIEKCETWETVLTEVRDGLEKFRHLLRRDVTDADIEKLLQLQIRRISLFDMNKNRQELDDILKSMEETQDNLRHMKRFTIAYLQALLKKYGAAFPRRTVIADIAEVNVRDVALKNIKIGHDRLSHFVGSEVKNSNKGEDPLVCTEFDRLVLMRNDGQFKVMPISEKSYVGAVRDVFIADKNQVYSMIYRDRKTNTYFAKRFRIDHYIMDKDYETLPENCIIEALYTNYGIVIHCDFAQRKRQRAQFVDVNFDEIPIRSAGARGFKIAHYDIEKFTLLKRGSATNPEGGDVPPPAGSSTTPPADAGAPGTPPDAAPPPPPPDTSDAAEPGDVDGNDASAKAAPPPPPAKLPKKATPPPADATVPRAAASGGKQPKAPGVPPPAAAKPKPGPASPKATAPKAPTTNRAKPAMPAPPQKAAKTHDAKAPMEKTRPTAAKAAEPAAKPSPPARKAEKRIEPPTPAAKPTAKNRAGAAKADKTPKPLVGVKGDGTGPAMRKLIDENTPFFLE